MKRCSKDQHGEACIATQNAVQPLKRRVMWSAIAMWMIACGAITEHRPVELGPAPQRPLPRQVHYTLTLPPALMAATVRVCFEGPAPSQLVAGVAQPRAQLKHAQLRPPHPKRVHNADPIAHGRALQVRDRSISLRGVPSDACIEYQITLPDARHITLPESRVYATSEWLYRPPADERTGMVFELEVELPANVDASLPFPTLAPHRYVIPTSAFLYLSQGVFGHFDVEEFELSGCLVAVVFPQDFPQRARQAVLMQLKRALPAVATVTGTFPRKTLRVVVAPVAESSPSGSAIVFGQVTRGGGGSVLLLVRRDATRESMANDWTCIHELSHLLLPFVEREDAWLSEGFSTYYQEVLRGRSGLSSHQLTWSRILNGTQRTMRTSTPLAQQSARMYERHNYPDVYWGGAAYALAVDVALRQQGQSLDAVLKKLDAARLDRHPPQSATELLSKLDRLSGTAIFRDTAEQLVYGPADKAAQAHAALLFNLGLIACDGARTDDCDPQSARLVLAASQPEHSLRDAILNHPAGTQPR